MTQKNRQKENSRQKKELKAAEVEAILLVAGDPVEITKLRKYLKLSKAEGDSVLAILAEKYKQAVSGLQLLTKDGKIQLVTKPEYAKLVAKFLNKTLNEDLTPAALETLTIVAYRGPVTRAQIEEIRGVNCSFPLRVLSLRGLVEKKQNPVDSRSYLYQISFDFLRRLGLKTVEELPDYRQLRQQISSLEEEIKKGDKKEKKEEKREKKEKKKKEMARWATTR